MYLIWGVKFVAGFCCILCREGWFDSYSFSLYNSSCCLWFSWFRRFQFCIDVLLISSISERERWIILIIDFLSCFWRGVFLFFAVFFWAGNFFPLNWSFRFLIISSYELKFLWFLPLFVRIFSLWKFSWIKMASWFLNYFWIVMSNEWRCWFLNSISTFLWKLYDLISLYDFIAIIRKKA